MPIIYQPREILNYRNLIGGPLLTVGLQAAIDFIAGNGKPWAHYPGVALGSMATATGIVGAAATLYVVGDTLDALVFKSPEGSDVRIFLNGVAQSDIATYAVTSAWETISLALSGGVNRVDFVNVVSSVAEHTSPIQWLALGPITVYGTDAYAERSEVTDNVDTIVFRIQDSESDVKYSSVPVYVDSGFTVAQLQAFSDLIAPEIDAVTGGKIVAIEVTLSLDIPSGVSGKSIETGALNERGGLIGFTTAGPRSESVRIPAIKRSIMSGEEFSLADGGAVEDLVTRLTTATSAAGASVRPKSANGYNLTAATYGKKSFRKQ